MAKSYHFQINIHTICYHIAINICNQTCNHCKHIDNATDANKTNMQPVPGRPAGGTNAGRRVGGSWAAGGGKKCRLAGGGTNTCGQAGG